MEKKKQLDINELEQVNGGQVQVAADAWYGLDGSVLPFEKGSRQRVKWLSDAEREALSDAVNLKN